MGELFPLKPDRPRPGVLPLTLPTLLTGKPRQERPSLAPRTPLCGPGGLASSQACGHPCCVPTATSTWPPSPRNTQSSSSCACSPRRPARSSRCGRWRPKTSGPSWGSCWTVSWRGAVGPGHSSKAGATGAARPLRLCTPIAAPLRCVLPPFAWGSHVLPALPPSQQKVADLLPP